MNIKLIFSISVLFLSMFLSGQKVTVTTLLEEDISIRAIHIVENRVYYTGTNSKFGFVNTDDFTEKKQKRLSKDTLQFRTLAYDGESFYTINIESPNRFFKVNKNTLEAEVIHTDYSPNGFYDALVFDGDSFYTFSDPDDHLNLKWIKFNSQPFFTQTIFSNMKMKKGEAAFAASNGNIAFSKNYIWLATGGVASRIFRLNKKSNSIEVFNTPFVQGESTKGIYAIDFYKDKFGIAVGGDYIKQSDNKNNIATSFDGGKTWTVQASGANLGYKTCVQIQPNSKGKVIVAIGDSSVELSQDYGKTWTSISNEKDLYVARWLNKNILILAGKNRMIKMDIKW